MVSFEPGLDMQVVPQENPHITTSAIIPRRSRWIMTLPESHIASSWMFSGEVIIPPDAHGRGNTKRQCFIMMKNKKGWPWKGERVLQPGQMARSILRL